MGKQPLFDECHRLIDEVIQARQTPRTVIFNYESWAKAMIEAHADNWIKYNPTTYCGLAHCIDPNQTADIVVTHEPLHVVQAAIRPAALRPR
jgi:hypothetical protein